MSYIARADVSASLGIAALSSVLTGVSNDSLDALCTRVCARIDGRIGSRYSTPVESPAVAVAALRDCALTLATWDLLQARLVADSYQALGDAAKDAMRWLDRLADGDASLPGDPALASPGASSAATVGGSDVPVFAPSSDPEDGEVFVA